MLRKRVAVLVGSGLALALAGCGSTDAPAEEAPEAVEQTEVAEDGGAGPLDRIRGVVDQTESVESFRALVSSTGSGAVSDVEVAYVSTPEPTVEMVMVSEGEEITVLMRGSEMVTGSAASGWMSIDGDESPGLDEAANPMTEVERLIAAPEVEEAGTEEVNGVETTKYTGVYSVEDVLADLEGEERTIAEQAYAEMGVSEVAFTLWVDADGLPRRLDSEMGGVSNTTEFLEFNGPVEIDYPDESEITSLDELVDGLEGL